MSLWDKFREAVEDEVEKVVETVTNPFSPPKIERLIDPSGQVVPDLGDVGRAAQSAFDQDKTAQALGFNNWEDMSVNVLTAGTAGIGEDGGLEWGDTGQWLDETVGEISGRNQKRAALHEQNKRYEEEKALRDKMLKEEEMRREMEDRSASSFAGIGRNYGRSTSSLTSTLGDQRDFLGL